MSYTSRKLLTKIYDLNINSNKSKNQKKNNDSILFRNRIKSRKNKKCYIEVNKTEKGLNNKDKRNIKLKLGNTNKTIELKKFPLIPKLNIKNIKIKNNEIITDDSKVQKSMLLLDYKLIECSSEDSKHQLRELKNGINGSGWQSERFSQYPQYIYILFTKPVYIKRIELLIHEKNIPSIIRFYSYYPKDIKNNFISNYKEAEYNLVGFIKTNNNEDTNFKSRELRKIYPNMVSLFFKIEFDKNYFNIYNLFNQVGINKLDFFGEYLDYIGGTERNNELQIKHATKKNFYNDYNLIGICDEQLKELKKQMKYNIEIENYLECKNIKYRIEKIRHYGKKVYELESEKSIALNNDDYSKALKIQNSVDKMKKDILNISNLNSPSPNNNRLILSESFLKQKYLKKITEPFFDDIKETPKVYRIKNKSENESIDNNISILNRTNIINSFDNFISHDEIILPTVLKKYNPDLEENNSLYIKESIHDEEKGKLEVLSQEILDEYSFITQIIGEENLQKIFSKQILYKEESMNIFLDKLEDIINNNKNNYEKIIESILKLCLILIEETLPLAIIKIFEIIKKLFNIIEKNEIKIKLENNIKGELLSKIKIKLGDVNIKIREKASEVYSFLITLTYCDFDNLIEELINYGIDKTNVNLIFGQLCVVINILNNFNESIKNKFPSELIFEYLINNLNNINQEIRKKTRFCIKLFFDIFDIEKFKNLLDKINEREIKELINDIPKLQNFFPDIKNNITISVKNKVLSKRVFKIKMKNINLKKKLLFKRNPSFSTKNQEKNESQ